MTRGWLSDDRSALAIDRILDAASILFQEHGPTAVSMHAVAEAAGCGRTTVYRYFENRQSLQLAFAEREMRRLGKLVAERTAAFDDPAERLIEGILAIIELVRTTPAIRAWFEHGAEDVIFEVAYSSSVAESLVMHYLPQTEDRYTRADWLVRGIMSILMHPPADQHCERKLVSRFLVPAVLAPQDATATK